MKLSVIYRKVGFELGIIIGVVLGIIIGVVLMGISTDLMVTYSSVLEIIGQYC